MNLLHYFKSLTQLIKVLIILVILLFFSELDFPSTMKEINYQKTVTWARYTNNEIISLVILITTGDEKYKIKSLSNLFKETQIIHLLVISGSNIIIFLEFINIFILRRNKTSYVISFLLILTYLKFTGYPQTLIRALISFSISEIISSKGIRSSTFPYLFVTVSVLGLTYFAGNLGMSFFLSATYSIAIIIFSRITVIDPNMGKIAKFLIFNIYITAISYILFYNYPNFSTCVSLFANIFVTTVFEPAILISYLMYFMPATEDYKLISIVFIIFFKVLEYILLYIGFIRKLTYNICYEE